jgi:hypothetical protein
MRTFNVRVRTLMGIIAALAVLIAVLSPLYPLGPPPCLTPPMTVKWLITRPVTASCTDCHGQR